MKICKVQLQGKPCQ